MTDNKYTFSCPVCFKMQYIEPSIFMQMGINIGSVNCLKCKTHLKMEIVDVEKQLAKAVVYPATPPKLKKINIEKYEPVQKRKV